MRVVILGLGGDPRWETDKLKARNESDELWAINDWWSRYYAATPDRAVQIHASLPDEPLVARWLHWRGVYRFLGDRAILGSPDPRFPEATVHDMMAIEQEFGADKTTSSVSCAMLIALKHHNATAVHLAGCPLSHPREHAGQAPGILRTIALLESRGVEVCWAHREKFERKVDWAGVPDIDMWSYWRRSADLDLVESYLTHRRKQ